ncbi:hypothetical protein ACTGJ9_016400 [Bradyrhizobium sp. RDM12]
MSVYPSARPLSWLLGRPGLVLALVVQSGIGASHAGPLTPFRNEAQAQRHCPGDEVVWLDFRLGRYYSQRQKRYGSGFNGSYVCRKEAKSSGFRRSLLGLR